MTSQEFAQRLSEGINTSTTDVIGMLQSVLPHDTITMSYGLYNGMLRHPGFIGAYNHFFQSPEKSLIEMIIPGRVMLMKTGHLIVVI